MVPFCRLLAGTAGLDFMGGRILCEKALAAEMVSCKLAGYCILLRARACCGHSVSFDKFGFCVPHAELYNSHSHLFARRCTANEDEQSIEAT